MSDLHLLQPAKIKNAYIRNQAAGLFHLFFPKYYFRTIAAWTNARLKKHSNSTIPDHKLQAYVGLEMAMSVLTFSQISKYWKNRMFCGHLDFQRVMSHDNFQKIHL